MRLEGFVVKEVVFFFAGRADTSDCAGNEHCDADGNKDRGQVIAQAGQVGQHRMPFVEPHKLTPLLGMLESPRGFSASWSLEKHHLTGDRRSENYFCQHLASNFHTIETFLSCRRFPGLQSGEEIAKINRARFFQRGPCNRATHPLALS
jgi:hypothetical protein